MASTVSSKKMEWRQASFQDTGLIRKREFELKEQTDHRLVFEITSNDESLQNYPYHFRVEIDYELQGKEITITYRVQNLESDQVMPYFIGGHPAFRCPLLTDEDYEDYELIFEKRRNLQRPSLVHRNWFGRSPAADAIFRS